MKKSTYGLTAWLFLIIAVVITSMMLFQNSKALTSITADKFETMWKNNQIKSIEVNSDGRISTVEIVANDNNRYSTSIASTRLDDFLKDNANDTVTQKYKEPTTIPVWVQFLPTGILIIFTVMMMVMFMNQSQGGGGRGVMSFGKSKAQKATNDKKVTFKDVAGEDEEKAELEEVVDFLKYPKKYRDMGARIPKGVLLVGPPGTGKTLLAKAVAGEAGVAFFSISGSDFVEMFVGVGASRVRDLFETAKKNSPCIIFIDEIDAVARQRGAGLGGGHDEREQTLNQLLVEMDGFGIHEDIIVIAATNRPDILDKAILRPGRFDRQILVGAPDAKGREEILKVHSKNKPLAEDVNLKTLAKRTPGFTGADLENLMNEASILSVRARKSTITMEELEEAITRVIAGPEKKSRVISEKDRKLTAYHEAGHAIVMRNLPNADPVHQISIIPRGSAGGYTMHLPEEDRSYMSKEGLKDEMVSLLGGRVAEKLILGDISTGASNDIERATNIARSMVMKYGMSDKLGTIAFGDEQGEVFLGRDFGRSKNYSEEVAAEIDEEIKMFITEAYNRSETILIENMDKLHLVAKALLEKEKLEADEFESLISTGKYPDGSSVEEISEKKKESEDISTEVKEENDKEMTLEDFEKKDL
ncbi:ATP-dependent zinc metalloprotease FtsH [Clostridium bornimense]|uniref:ATP-dependent zinc metalloprotease FtsH n=1 Tax=Clostridium bornimense TaxID=1216932 RepID=W6S188_9CLOT|nr:ATP-dependent zinc metalloprotease FtsH [Clostridium bornimense]CDM69639.1 ATP-dependent zinc metalloprotease FtsH [Clostridium bornimense]